MPPSPATRAAFDAALGVFKALGAEIRDVSFRLFSNITRR